MNVVLLTFANNNSKPLKNLAEEDRRVYSILSKMASEEKDWHIQHNSFARPRDIAQDIALYRDKLTIFSYSGHADRDVLITDDGAASAEGIAALLGKCPNLKLVLLNGCSTEGQVDRLLEVGVPCVIATSAPILDFAATQFSISFFESLIERKYTINKAYNIALDIAKTISSSKIEAKRGMFKRSSDSNRPLWGIFYPDGQEIKQEWSIFNTKLVIEEKFVPNELLLTKIWEAIAPFIEKKKQFTQMDKMDSIITELPHPISEYLRKLIAKSAPGEREEIFYSELSFHRLQYLLFTYTTCIELLAFTMLSQIWDELVNKRINILSPKLKNYLKEFFGLTDRERKVYNLTMLIQAMGNCMETNGIDPFVSEYQQLRKLFVEQTDFFKACQYIEKIKSEVIPNDELSDDRAKYLCVQIEKKLAIVMSELGFLVKYKMASMKDIYFIKLKHQLAPKYRWNFVELRFRPAGMDIIDETVKESIDNASVIILNEEGGKIKYLNLSPFIIDENSFDQRAKLANLCVFQSFEKMAEAFTFRHIYQPTSPHLIVHKSSSYISLITDQFNTFYKLVFNQKLV